MLGDLKVGCPPPCISELLRNWVGSTAVDAN